MEQVSLGRETFEQQTNQRDDLTAQYCAYAVKMVPIIIEYWDTK